jgi:hypothetical protein
MGKNWYHAEGQAITRKAKVQLALSALSS